MWNPISQLVHWEGMPGRKIQGVQILNRSSNIVCISSPKMFTLMLDPKFETNLKTVGVSELKPALPVQE